MAMITLQRPQRGDVVITQAVDGFWTSPPLDDSHTPGKADTFEAAVASGGLIAYLERVDLWLMDTHTQLSLLVNCRRRQLAKRSSLRTAKCSLFKGTRWKNTRRL